MPQKSLSTFATGARQLVVQDALETTAVGGLQLVVIDPVDDREIGAGGRSADTRTFFGAGLEMSRCLASLDGEEAGALQGDVDAEIAPWQVGRVAL